MAKKQKTKAEEKAAEKRRYTHRTYSKAMHKITRAYQTNDTRIKACPACTLPLSWDDGEASFSFYHECDENYPLSVFAEFSDALLLLYGAHQPTLFAAEVAAV
jgi:hypothetical protein